ncbi:hypothetical protein B0G81_7872 [Paraburkholderia sp. BL6665CI2N2]|uniref:hypothetical protein n=1 Tax=Paraburkholderia sp. BL6665CI2N2 TaxID=1938806 RepID=UPI001065FD09|nr:hypothetical protein [Paraburkholderia sp. BL6665CI2N2]TDY16762.1 hypothetical protein B0G81_7872 [Paraburkholderia sp. BL6665CI2N2]
MGRPAITPAAEAALNAAGIHPMQLLARHIHRDWEDLSVEDLAENELALLTDKRLLSSYGLPKGGKVWVITEADRSATTILLPENY